MAEGAKYGLVQSRTGRVGPVPKLCDSEFRERLLLIAAGGVSRRGCARLMGIRPATLLDWLSRGEALPDVEPYGSFARAFQQAERALEGVAAPLLVREVHRIAKARKKAKPSEAMPIGDRLLLMSLLKAKHPHDWGHSSHREPTQEADPDAWLDRAGLELEQLRTLLRDGEETLDKALRPELDAVVLRMLSDGWTPAKDTLAQLLARKRTSK
jgi:hypothetical protein